MQPKTPVPYQGFEKKDASEFDFYNPPQNWVMNPYQMMPMQGGPMHGGPMQGGPMHGGPMQGGPMQGGPMHGGPMQGGPMPYPQDQMGEVYSDDNFYSDYMECNSVGFHSAHSHSSRSSDGHFHEKPYYELQRKSEPIPISGFEDHYYNPQHAMHAFAGMPQNPNDRRVTSVFVPQQPNMISHTGSSSRSLYSGNFAQGTPIYGMNPSFPKQYQNPKLKQGFKFQNSPHIQSVELLHEDEESPLGDSRLRAGSDYSISKPDDGLGGFAVVDRISDSKSGDKGSTFGTVNKTDDGSEFSGRDLTEIFSVNEQETPTLVFPLAKPKTNEEMESVLQAYKQDLYLGFKVLSDINDPTTTSKPKQKPAAIKDPTQPKKKEGCGFHSMSFLGSMAMGWSKKKGS
jgi:hypothetical protein